MSHRRYTIPSLSKYLLISAICMIQVAWAGKEDKNDKGQKNEGRHNTPQQSIRTTGNPGSQWVAQSNDPVVLACVVPAATLVERSVASLPASLHHYAANQAITAIRMTGASALNQWSKADATLVTCYEWKNRFDAAIREFAYTQEGSREGR